MILNGKNREILEKLRQLSMFFGEYQKLKSIDRQNNIEIVLKNENCGHLAVFNFRTLFMNGLTADFQYEYSKN